MRQVLFLGLVWLIAVQSAFGNVDASSSWIVLTELPSQYSTQSNESLYLWTPGIEDSDDLVCDIYDASVEPWEPAGVSLALPSYGGGFRPLSGEDLRTLRPGVYGLRFWVANKPQFQAEVTLTIVGPVELPEDAQQPPLPEPEAPDDKPQDDKPGTPVSPDSPFNPEDFDLVVGAGLVEYKPRPDSQVIYVPSGGSIRAAYDKLRDGYPDFIVLQAGGVYDVTSPINWTKSGRSTSEPMVVTVMGNGPRPRVRANNGFAITTGGNIRNLVFDGLHITAPQRDPDDPSFNGGKNYVEGFKISTPASNIVFQDFEVSYFTFGMVFQDWADNGGALRIRNITIRRSYIHDCYAYGAGKHSSGVFGVEVDGLVIEDSFFDHNGWSARVSGSMRFGLNHNTYLLNCHNLVYRNNLSSRGSYMGLKIRSNDQFGISQNLLIENNLFVNNAKDVGIGDNVHKGPATAKNVRILGNVSSQCWAAYGGDYFGEAVTVMKTDGCLIERNIFIEKDQPERSRYVQPAINFSTSTTLRNVMIKSNIIRWPEIGYFSGKPIALIAGNGQPITHSAITQQGNLVNVSTALFQNPQRNVASYDQSIGGSGSYLNFLANARKAHSQRGMIDQRFTAAAVIDYVRKGFAGK